MTHRLVLLEYVHKGKIEFEMEAKPKLRLIELLLANEKDDISVGMCELADKFEVLSAPFALLC